MKGSLNLIRDACDKNQTEIFILFPFFLFLFSNLRCCIEMKGSDFVEVFWSCVCSWRWMRWDSCSLLLCWWRGLGLVMIVSNYRIFESSFFILLFVFVFGFRGWTDDDTIWSHNDSLFFIFISFFLFDKSHDLMKFGQQFV